MFSVLDSALLLYKTRFVFIICSPFLTPSYSYTSPAGLFIIMNSLSLTPSYSFLYQTRVIYSHFTIVLLCLTLISDQVQIFSFLDSVLLILISDQGNIFSFYYNFTLSYSYIRPGSYILYPWLRPTIIRDRVHIFSILDSVLLLYQTRFLCCLSFFIFISCNLQNNPRERVLDIQW